VKGRTDIDLLMNAGSADWIVADEDDYVVRARSHTGDLQGLATLRSVLREQVLAPPLFDALLNAGGFVVITCPDLQSVCALIADTMCLPWQPMQAWMNQLCALWRWRISPISADENAPRCGVTAIEGQTSAPIDSHFDCAECGTVAR
jgi:hypothetical protein